MGFGECQMGIDFLELARFQLFTEKANLFFYRAVLFDTALNAVYGMQYGGVIAVK